MRIRTVLIIISLYSCSSKPNSENRISIRDSILKRHLLAVDTLPYYDTNNLDYQILRAYSNNDTLTLKRVQDYSELIYSRKKQNTFFDSCIQIADFVNLNADEAYRFEFGGAFCHYNTLTTIVKLNDTIKVSSLVYQYAYDTNPCKIIDQNEVLLDSRSWEKFKEIIDAADLWGQKEDNGHHGLDGWTLSAYGYQKKVHWHPERRIYISRWSEGNHPLNKCYLMLLKFCSIKTGCFYPA